MLSIGNSQYNSGGVCYNIVNAILSGFITMNEFVFLFVPALRGNKLIPYFIPKLYSG